MPPNTPNRSGQRQSDRYAVPDVPIGDFNAGGWGGNPRYAAPDSRGNYQYALSPVTAWAASLRTSTMGTPDPSRTKQIPRHDYRPEPDIAPETWWLGDGPGRIKQAQHTRSETVDADGWTEFQPMRGFKRAAPDPRRSPPNPIRLTNQLSPANYMFTRPFDQHSARQLNGQHFSLADHRRNYPVLGMQPAPARRNTYRIDPPPWDTNIVDTVPLSPPGPGRVLVSDLPSRGRSYRL